MQRHLYEHFHTWYSYQVTVGFCKIPMLLSLIRPILRYPLRVKITGLIPLKQRHLWDFILKVLTELLPYIVIEKVLLFLDLNGLF